MNHAKTTNRTMPSTRRRIGSNCTMPPPVGEILSTRSMPIGAVHLPQRAVSPDRDSGTLFIAPQAGQRTSIDSVIGVGHETLFSASHAARCVARHGVRSHAVPVALVGECSIPVV